MWEGVCPPTAEGLSRTQVGRGAAHPVITSRTVCATTLTSILGFPSLWRILTNPRPLPWPHSSCPRPSPERKPLYPVLMPGPTIVLTRQNNVLLFYLVAFLIMFQNTRLHRGKR